MFKRLSLLILSITILINTSFAWSNDYRVGDLILNHSVARATPPGASVAAGYLTIENIGDTEDRLIGGSASFAGAVEIHEMKMDADVMKMRQLEGGLPVAPDQTVGLEPGGYHLMFTGLKEQLKRGEERQVQLTFEKAGSIDVIFEVKSIAETMKKKHSH